MKSIFICSANAIADLVPSLKSDELGTVVFAVDTSGSIDHETINQFASELTAIIETFQVCCVVIYCDSKVAGVQVSKMAGGAGGSTNVNSFLSVPGVLV